MAKYRAEEQLSIDELPLCRDIMIEHFHRSKAASKEAFRQEILADLSKIRDKLTSLLNENHHVTDIEKLERDEFVIDQGREVRYNEEESAVCKEIREEAQKTILKFELLRERVMESTHNTMQVKATACKSLMSDVLLHNYAVRQQTYGEKTMIEQIKIQRKMEMNAKYSRAREALNEEEFSKDKEQYFMNRTTGAPEFATDKAIEEAAAKFKE